MGRPGNRFELSGEAVWQLLRGDWFDAAVDLSRLGPPERRSGIRSLRPTAARTRRSGCAKLSAWALGGRAARRSAWRRCKQFAEFLGLPVGFHWYNWHQIPFDNDYPHYFPTKPGFAEGVRELQAAGVFVMPYINGRLWDTRDKGSEDFEFTAWRGRRPARTRQGEPYTETYGSKEADGSPVQPGRDVPGHAALAEQVSARSCCG